MVLIGLITAWLIVAVLSWVLYLLVRQGGQTLNRLDAIEAELVIARMSAVSRPGSGTDGIEPAAQKQADPLAKSKLNRSGLPVGTVAPDFQLSSLEGESISLEDFRGREFVVVLMTHDCEPCGELARKLISLEPELLRRSVLVITRGTPEMNRGKFGHDVPPFRVGMQHGWEVSRAYATFKFPSAYRIDAAGFIRSEVAVGPNEILNLVLDVLSGEEGQAKTDSVNITVMN